MVQLLALAHDRGCEAELAVRIAADLEARTLPDLATLRASFAPNAADISLVSVHLAALASHGELLDSTVQTGEVA